MSPLRRVGPHATADSRSRRQNRAFFEESLYCELLGRREAARTQGGCHDGASDLGSWPRLQLACVCPISQCSGALARRHGVRRAWILRHRLWQWLLTVWLWKRSLFWRLCTRSIRLSSGGEAGLRGKAGRLRQRCPRVRSTAGCPGAFESGIPARLAKGLVSQLTAFAYQSPTPATRYAAMLRFAASTRTTGVFDVCQHCGLYSSSSRTTAATLPTSRPRAPVDGVGLPSELPTGAASISPRSSRARFKCRRTPTGLPSRIFTHAAARRISPWTHWASWVFRPSAIQNPSQASWDSQ